MSGTHHIHINGIVQGVGFRPMVYQQAQAAGLQGYVKNGSDGVHIFINASVREAGAFFEQVLRSAPAQAHIISATIRQVAHQTFSSFSILVGEVVPSIVGENAPSLVGEDAPPLIGEDAPPLVGKQVLISADKTLCQECRRELHDPNNRRYRYPFITCTHCGPRYSIMHKLPYERHFTSMQPFTMCRHCHDEYEDVSDRRFFSQTNSCADCGITLCLHEDASSILSTHTGTVLSYVQDLLDQGKIIAVKGLGGYLLLCRADHPETIQLLRTRKRRPRKPLAILYPGMQSIRNEFSVNIQEETLLTSEAAPIVLLYPRQEALDLLAIDDIAPGLKRIGVMLPGNPLLELITHDHGRPLVATSANISGSPIIYKTEDALNWLFGIADYIVSDNREIEVPQDDSVIQVCRYAGQPTLLRRSRGYAPSFLNAPPSFPADAANPSGCLLSMGAFVKSSFTLVVNGNVFISQYLGSGERYESQLMYKDTLEHWLTLYGARPEVILTDLHTDYFSHQYGRQLAEKYGAAVQAIQHHEAHFAAILAEHDLLPSARRADEAKSILGVIWDGTGLGTDGHIWGGEFFTYARGQLSRPYHVDYFPVVAGDKIALEPRIAALCACNGMETVVNELKRKFTRTEWNNYRILIQTTKTFSSSIGRLFDAAASMLDLCDRQTYEGEAAMYLQALAEEYVCEHGFDMAETYSITDLPRISPSSIMLGISMDIQKGRSRQYIAAKFHYSLVRLIGIIAQDAQVDKVCFSGGVFQNALLVDWIQHVCHGQYNLYFHRHLSPNDENISFGQMIYHQYKIHSLPFTGQGAKPYDHVLSNSR